MNSHASAHMAPETRERQNQTHSGAKVPPTMRGPRVPNPGHGHPHLPQSAAGLRQNGYATQPEHISSCNLNQEDPEASTQLTTRRIPQASMQPTVGRAAGGGCLKIAPRTMHPRGTMDEGRQPPTISFASTSFVEGLLSGLTLPTQILVEGMLSKYIQKPKILGSVKVQACCQPVLAWSKQPKMCSMD